MKPSELRLHLPTYADDELPPALRAEVDQCLATDPGSRAEVERWKALRRGAQRALQSEPLPADLRDRLLERLATTRRRGRLLRLGPVVGTLSAAALIMIGVFAWWSTGRSDVPPALLTPERLARIYQRCALERHHDPFQLAHKSPREAAATLAKEPRVTYALNIPDLSSAGFHLEGVCLCPPSDGVQGVHAYYERNDADQRPDRHPQDVVSFFSLARRVRLDRCSTLCKSGRGPQHPQREYVVASTGDDVTVLKWDEQSRSYAICSALRSDELMQIVDRLNVAALSPSSPAGLATGATPHVAHFTIAVAALAAGALSLVSRRRGP